MKAHNPTIVGKGGGGGTSALRLFNYSLAVLSCELELIYFRFVVILDTMETKYNIGHDDRKKCILPIGVERTVITD